MTATLTRTSQALAEWTKVFPRQITETYTSSVTFIKQLTVVAVSTITYLKNAFPEDNYTVDQFGGLKIRVLKNKCEDELAQFLITALTQAFDAFDKKYLHQIALCFYEETCAADNLLEYHVFEYAYNSEGASLRVRSGGRGNAEVTKGSDPAACSLEAVRDRTLQLLRACMVMLSQTSLPESYDVSLRLYYNEAAPEGYQAPGFCSAREEEEDALLETADFRVKLGGVRTPFHAVHMHTYLREMHAQTHVSCEPQVSQTSHRDELNNDAPMDAGAVRCECDRSDRPAYTALLVCRHCGYRQHAACYGLLTSGGGDVPSAAHCCVECADRTGDATDLELARASNRPCYALFRRALCWLAAGRAGGVRALCGNTLAEAVSLGKTSSRKLLRVLRAHGLLAVDPPTDDTIPIDVVTDKLESILQRHFVTESMDEDIATRLVEESLSQRSDPLSEVLYPLERVSLQAASRVDIASVASKPAADPAMDQYRSVLTDSEEPLPPPAKEPRKRKAELPRTGVKTKKVRASRN